MPSNKNNKDLKSLVTKSLSQLSSLKSNMKKVKKGKLSNFNKMPPIHDYISPSQLFHYSKKDPFQDVLIKHPNFFITNFNNNEIPKEDTFTQFLMNQGNQFEYNVKEYFKTTMNFSMKELPMHGGSVPDTTIYNDSVKAMKEGYDIIYQPCLFDPQSKLYGHPDFLIRADRFNQISPNTKYPSGNVNAKSVFGNYHYIVMDTKFRTLKLNSTNEKMLNSSSEFYYKMQLTIYSLCLEYVQKYLPNYAYIIGRGYRSEYQENNVKYKQYSNDIFNTLGAVDMWNLESETKNSKFNILAFIGEAIQWRHTLDIITEDTLSEVNWQNPIESYYRPNMTNKYTSTDKCDFSNIRNHIAKMQCEPTLIANVGNDEREKLHDNGIFSSKDPNCSVKAMGINKKSVKQRNITTRLLQLQDNNNILPAISFRRISNQKINQKMPTNRDIIRSTINKSYMVLDFEVANNIGDDFTNLPLSKVDSSAYFIGIIDTSLTGNKYIPFVSDNLTNNSELINFKNFLTYMAPYYNGIKSIQKPHIFVWSGAENVFLNTLLEKHKDKLSEDEIKLVENIQDGLVDMFRMFEMEEIIIKGTNTLSLKDVAKRLYEMKIIPTIWEDDINGISSMSTVERLNSESKLANINLISHPEFGKMIEYNRVDCQVIVEIIDWLQKKVKTY